uniref:HAT C-terminal dimerisation domain-containing protein n=1 Tax=Octopus bimaculoides TaxID=37653 RepID=A0A0L8HTB3_OCTBM
METIIVTALMESNSTTSNEDKEDDFFSNITWFQESRSHRSLKSKARNMVKTWLEAVTKEVLTEVTFLGEQVLIDLFTKYNTAISSSAAVGCLFSIGQDILRAKKATLSDGNFEKLMFMKGNQHHVMVMEKAQPEWYTLIII